MSVYNTSFKTTWILLTTTLGLIVWDIYARYFPGGTISEVMLSCATRHPILPFLFDVLSGHLFWPQLPDDKNV